MKDKCEHEMKISKKNWTLSQLHVVRILIYLKRTSAKKIKYCMKPKYDGTYLNRCIEL